MPDYQDKPRQTVSAKAVEQFIARWRDDESGARRIAATLARLGRLADESVDGHARHRPRRAT